MVSCIVPHSRRSTLTLDTVAEYCCAIYMYSIHQGNEQLAYSDQPLKEGNVVSADLVSIFPIDAMYRL